MTGRRLDRFRCFIADRLVWLDEGINLALLGRHETLTRRAVRARRHHRRWGRWLCAVLDWLDPGHCGD